MNPAIYYLSSFKRNEGLLYAYSLRRVVPGYTGPGIQVRRGTGTTTASFQDFHFNSSGELDQAAILSFVGAGAVGYVRTLYDQTGSGVDLGPIGAVVTREPRIVNSGSPAGSIVTKNGKIAMSFVAGGFNYLRTVTTLTHDVNNLSIFVVLSNTNLTLTQPCVTINNSSAVSEITFPRSVGGSDYYNYNAGDAIVLGTTTTDNKVYSSLSTPTSISSFKNNVISAGSPLANVNPAIGKSITLGYTTSNFIGTVQEVLIYENQKFNRSAITAEIMSYYSIV
jgi:hypothetical protein